MTLLVQAAEVTYAHGGNQIFDGVSFEVPTGQMVTFRADVFNIMNSSAVEDRNEIGDLDLGEPSASYGLPRVYQSPRSVRLGVDIAF